MLQSFDQCPYVHIFVNVQFFRTLLPCSRKQKDRWTQLASFTLTVFTWDCYVTRESPLHPLPFLGRWQPALTSLLKSSTRLCVPHCLHWASLTAPYPFHKGCRMAQWTFVPTQNHRIHHKYHAPSIRYPHFLFSGKTGVCFRSASCKQRADIPSVCGCCLPTSASFLIWRTSVDQDAPT